MQALHAFFGVGAVLGPAIVGIIQFRLSNLCLCLICLVPTTIAVVSSCMDGTKKHTEGGAGAGAGYERTECDAISDTCRQRSSPLKSIDDGETAGSVTSQAQTEAQAQCVATGKRGQDTGEVEGTSEVPNRLRVALILFYFIYVGLETGFGGEFSALLYCTSVKYNYIMRQPLLCMPMHTCFLSALWHGFVCCDTQPPHAPPLHT